MKSQKPINIEHGMEITKPWSSQMYEHNEVISFEMKNNILKSWNKLVEDLGDINMDTPWVLFKKDDDIVKLQTSITGFKYGEGFTIGRVIEGVKSELEYMPNYRLHEEYDYLVSINFVPKIKCGLVGYSKKTNYVFNQNTPSPILD